MDLLETVLRTSNAEKFLQNFRNFSVDSRTLKILNEEDLKILGVDDEEVRQSILKHSANLQIPSEVNVDLVFDKEYLKTILDEMVIHLNKHIANLSCANLREDIEICDIKLAPAALCLHNCVLSFENQLNTFETKVITTKKRRRRVRSKNILFPTIIATALVFFLCRKYVLYYK